MWHGLSLKTRLMLLFTLLLLAGMAVNVGLALKDAGPRVAAEDTSSMRLAQDFIESAAPALDASPDPGPALQALLKSLGHMRHITVRMRAGPDGASPSGQAGAGAPVPGQAGAGAPEEADPAADDDDSEVPAWFVRLIGPAPRQTGVEIAPGGRSLGTVVIAAEPLDEIGEIWDDMIAQLATGAVLAVALLAMTWFTVGRALAPLSGLLEAMRLIGKGRYDVRVPPSGPPELAAMCRQMNALAGVLGSTITEKQRLAERIVTLQDDERRDLARELHDEFGPHLFAIRAHVAALTRTAADGAARPVAEAARAIGEQVDALQACNRRVLRSLRPVALDELGLEAALAALIDGLSETRPEVDVAFASDFDLDAVETALALTIYRVVQEALTNVMRHADATQAEVAIGAAGRGALRLRVADNGIGMPEEPRDGFGLRGMKERLAVLGGRLDIRSSARSGTVVEAVIPTGGGHWRDDMPEREKFPI